MMISQDTVLCYREEPYMLSAGIVIEKPDITLDCNGATIQGYNSIRSAGIQLGRDEWWGETVSRATVKNCHIKNYESGIRIGDNKCCPWYEENEIKNNIITSNTHGINLYWSTRNNYITNNMIYNNQNAIYFYNERVLPSSINYNDMYSNDYAIYSTISGNIDAENNWWGSTNEVYIQSKIAGDATVDYTPWLTEGPEDRLSDLVTLNIRFETGKVIALINNTGENDAMNFKVSFLDTFRGELIKQKDVSIVALASQDSKEITIEWDIELKHQIYVVIDPDNAILESDETNNNLNKEYLGVLKYYIEADVPPVSSEIENFVKNNIEDGEIVTDEEQADVKVLIARHNPLIVWHFETLEGKGWGFYGGVLKFQDEICGKPYCGIVGNLEKEDKKEIYVEANDIDGFIAAAKSFVKNQDSFKATGNVVFLGEEDEEAIAVYDYLHTDDNENHYKEDSSEFKEIVGKALNSEMYETIESTVSLGGTDLRLINLKPAKSDLFREYIDEDNLPVVMGGGLWSDITAWEDLGGELSDEGFDVYLIEITGGPDMECDSCDDYTYDFLTDSVYPAYINHVLTETEKTKVKYIGHSNGARVALDSLTKGEVDPDEVDTLVLVGVPGAFSELSYFASLVDRSGAEAIESMREKEIDHVTFGRVAHELESWIGEAIAAILFARGENKKISLNLFEQYYNWIHNSDDSQPGNGLDIDYLTLVYGTDGLGSSEEDDLIVAVNDENAIFGNIQSDNKVIKGVKKQHSGLQEDEKVKSYVMESLTKGIY